MRRPAALAVLASLWLMTAFGLKVDAAPPVFLRAETSASGLRVFYDHEELFPVSILHASVPYTEASFEPGPSSQALGSFAWEPEAADLSTILCFLSDGQLCAFPDYPFQARASHPSSQEADDPPSLSIAEDAIEVRAADERAEAGEAGAEAEAEVQALAAIPMTHEQRERAAALAQAVALAGGDPELTPWLLRVETASARSVVEADASEVGSRSRTRVQGFEVLGGLIAVESASARAEASAGSGEAAAAGASVGAVRVGGFEARIVREGLAIGDARLSPTLAAPLQDALDAALAGLGLTLGPGAEETEATDGGMRASAYALSLDFRRGLLPDGLPEGTTGDDVIRLPIAFASAEVSEAEGIAPPKPVTKPGTGSRAPPPSAPEPVPAAPAPAAPAADVVPDARVVTAPAATELVAPAAPAAAPAVAALPLGVPPGVAVAAGAGALLMTIGLTALKVLEVLHG